MAVCDLIECILMVAAMADRKRMIAEHEHGYELDYSTSDDGCGHPTHSQSHEQRYLYCQSYYAQLVRELLRAGVVGALVRGSRHWLLRLQVHERTCSVLSQLVSAEPSPPWLVFVQPPEQQQQQQQQQHVGMCAFTLELSKQLLVARLDALAALRDTDAPALLENLQLMFSASSTPAHAAFGERRCDKFVRLVRQIISDSNVPSTSAGAGPGAGPGASYGADR
jgi:hypothetical protein